MRHSALKTIVIAAVLAMPLAAAAQENSIMQSFHPEKYPAPKTRAGTQTEPDHPNEAGKATSASERTALPENGK